MAAVELSQVRGRIGSTDLVSDVIGWILPESNEVKGQLFSSRALPFLDKVKPDFSMREATVETTLTLLADLRHGMKKMVSSVGRWGEPTLYMDSAVPGVAEPIGLLRLCSVSEDALASGVKMYARFGIIPNVDASNLLRIFRPAHAQWKNAYELLPTFQRNRSILPFLPFLPVQISGDTGHGLVRSRKMDFVSNVRQLAHLRRVARDEPYIYKFLSKNPRAPRKEGRIVLSIQGKQYPILNVVAGANQDIVHEIGQYYASSGVLASDEMVDFYQKATQ